MNECFNILSLRKILFTIYKYGTDINRLSKTNVHYIYTIVWVVIILTFMKWYEASFIMFLEQIS